MTRVVLKFGGSSVADADKIRHVARIIAGEADRKHQVVAVVSAMGKTTNGLVALAEALCEHPSGREYDALLATGEMVSTALMAMTLNHMGYAAIGLNGQQAGVKTEALFNRARILEIDTTALETHLQAGTIIIVTGFQGTNPSGEFTTLGRGGSDTSAVALAAALNADYCDIYTDVPGVFSTDPRVVPEAKRLDKMAYIEMLELARVGAKVLHPRSVETAQQGNVSLRVRSTFEPEDTGTLVTESVVYPAGELAPPVAGVACDANQVRITLTDVPDRPGVAAQVFGTLAEANISVDMIIQAQPRDLSTTTPTKGVVNDITFTVGATDAHAAQQVLTPLQAEMGAGLVMMDPDVAKVSIVGVGMIDRPGIAATLFKALAHGNVNIKMISTSEIKISCLVERAKADDAVRAIHAAFFPTATTVPLVSEKLGY